MKQKFRIDVSTGDEVIRLGEATSDWEELVELLLTMPNVEAVRLVKEDEQW